MYPVLWASPVTGYHVNNTQSICDSSGWNAKAQRCLPGIDVVCRLCGRITQSYPAGACRDQTMVELHEVTQKHCRDRCCKRNCSSVQLLLWKVQKDHTQDIPYPKLAVFILVQRLDLEGSKCWCVSDSSM